MRPEVNVEQLENDPVNSNCYLITVANADGCILVDPAQGEGFLLQQYLEKRNTAPDYIILTHEHFDHISSVEHLRKIYNCEVVASAACSQSITHPKKNLSLFQDQIGFSCAPADVLIEENGQCINWKGISLHFYLTPGHSEGGLCFSVNDNLFTGDTLLKEFKTIVKLPGGSKKKLKESAALLFQLFKSTTIVFPGHGASFQLSDINIASIINE